MYANANAASDRLTADVIADADRRYNPLGEYEIDLRGLRSWATGKLGDGAGSVRRVRFHGERRREGGEFAVDAAV